MFFLFENVFSVHQNFKNKFLLNFEKLDIGFLHFNGLRLLSKYNLNKNFIY
jgi:hypothetical protein